MVLEKAIAFSFEIYLKVAVSPLFFMVNGKWFCYMVRVNKQYRSVRKMEFCYEWR